MNDIFALLKKYIITILLLLWTITCLLFLSLDFTIKLEICKVDKNMSSRDISIYLLILLGIFLSILLYKKSYRKAINDFIIPFRKKGKELFFAINAIICIICILSFLVHFFYHKNGNDEFTFFNLTSFLLCIFSIFITSRVYFEIGKEKTNTLDEYLERLTDIVVKSDKGDKILIIAPTIILGQIDKSNSIIKNIYLDDILNAKGEIIFALLDWEDVESFEIRANTSRPVMDYITTPDSPRKALFDYHIKNWSLYIKDPKEMKDSMNKLLLGNMKRLKNKGGKFIKLSKEMFVKDDSSSSGFFAVANFTQGHYYMGNFMVSGRMQKFQGTYFENKHVQKQMQHMLRGVISDYCINDGDNRKQLDNIYNYNVDSVTN